MSRYSWGAELQVRKEQGDSDLPKIQDLRIMCNAWALCGADLVDHPTEKDSDGVSPKRARNIHLSQASWYHDSVFQKSLEYGPHKRGVVAWLEDRDRTTRSAARTLYADGLPWGECLIECIERKSRLIWELSNVGISDKVSMVRAVRQEDLVDDTDDDYPAKKSGGAGKGKGKGKRGRSSGTQRPEKPKKAKTYHESLAEKNKEIACPSLNSLTGCTKKQEDCPGQKKHVCSQCGYHGHSAVTCRRG